MLNYAAENPARLKASEYSFNDKWICSSGGMEVRVFGGYGGRREEVIEDKEVKETF
jgi:hypothetical protein